jgi:hypothetical protein
MELSGDVGEEAFKILSKRKEEWDKQIGAF